MKPSPKRAVYTQAEIQKRFEEWAALPAAEGEHFKRRNKAWNSYCDARDGLAEGSSERGLYSGIQPTDDRQMDMFARRYQS